MFIFCYSLNIILYSKCLEKLLWRSTRVWIKSFGVTFPLDNIQNLMKNKNGRRRSSIPFILPLLSTKNQVQEKRLPITLQQLDKMNFYEGEEHPLLPMSQILPNQQVKPSISLQEIKTNRLKKKTHSMQDPRRTAFSYSKYKVLIKMILVFMFISFYLDMLKNEIDQIPSNEQLTNSILIVNSILTIILLIFVFLTRLTQFQIHFNQKKILIFEKTEMLTIKIRKGVEKDIKTFFKESQNLRRTAVEMVIIFIHPIIFLEDYDVASWEPYLETDVIIQLNDILSYLMLTRVGIFVFLLLELMPYSSPRAQRIVCQNGKPFDLMFCIKCLIKQSPLKSIFIGMIIFIVTLGAALRISQGQILNREEVGLSNFENYSNCYWCIFITMTTVGYGDYYPKTYLGMIPIIVAAIFGVIMNSLLIMALSQYLTMTATEFKSHLTLLRLFVRQQVGQYLKQSMALAITFFSEAKKIQQKEQIQSQKKLKKSKKNIFSNKFVQSFHTMKNKIDYFKQTTRELKKMQDSQSLTQQMNRLFEIVSNSLKEFFQLQVNLKNQLEVVENKCELRTKEMKDLFNLEVENFIIKLYESQEFQTIMGSSPFHSPCDSEGQSGMQLRSTILGFQSKTNKSYSVFKTNRSIMKSQQQQVQEQKHQIVQKRIRKQETHGKSKKKVVIMDINDNESSKNEIPYSPLKNDIKIIITSQNKPQK